jgi:hypothetical protein
MTRPPPEIDLSQPAFRAPAWGDAAGIGIAAAVVVPQNVGPSRYVSREDLAGDQADRKIVMPTYGPL